VEHLLWFWLIEDDAFWKGAVSSGVFYLNQHQVRGALSVSQNRYIIWGAWVKRLAICVTNILGYPYKKPNISQLLIY
jgi:hypothetical protein